MNRRNFNKILSKTTLALGLWPTLSAFQNMEIPISELMGKGSPNLVSGSSYRLRPEVATAFEKLKNAAANDGIIIKVVSSYRDYAHQNRIWERKYRRFRESGLTPNASIEKIIEYSTIPGTSRHHWGTDLDLIDGSKNVEGDVLVPSKFHGTGPFCKFKEWMDKNAATYDFHLVYTDVLERKGFNYEPWHYSYAPLSIPYLKTYNKLDIKTLLQQEKIRGSAHLSDAFINRYRKENILDINPILLP